MKKLEKWASHYHDPKEDEVDTWLGELILAGFDVDVTKHGEGISVFFRDRSIHFYMPWTGYPSKYRVQVSSADQGVAWTTMKFTDLVSAAEYVNELLRASGP